MKVINCKVQVKEKHCHVVQIHLPFAVNVTLSLSLHCLLLIIDPEPSHSQWVAKLKDQARETAAIEPIDSPEFQGFLDFSLQWFLRPKQKFSPM